MAREKAEFRNMLCYLADVKQYPLTVPKGKAAQILGVSRAHLDKIIRRGHIKVQDGKIPIGSIASYLCG